jgi:hypothetical protein
VRASVRKIVTKISASIWRKFELQSGKIIKSYHSSAGDHHF